jgi:serine/threonine protein kinase
MELTVQNVYGLLLRSKLLSVEDARSMFARWKEESKDSTNLVQFASWMVANKYLTEYQATLLARGHADGFFLGDYKILDRLGKGRMAGVYKAQHKLGQVVALKVLPPSKARDPMMLARFQREGKLMLKLRHPNIVRGFQMGQEGELLYLVMEYLEGETLEDALTERKKFPPPEAVRIVYQALQGLQHIHEQNLIHRDLKPSNLMLVPGPNKSLTVKVLDIGLGRGVSEEGFNPDGGLTGEGVLLGTPDYMAPEQARDARAIDIRADIYSLGCVLYHLLAGQPPFPDTNIISQMIRHASEPPRPVAEFNRDVPDGLQQILNWMMAKAPEGRYPTPARAASALEVFLAAGTPPASSPDLDPDMQPYLEWLEKEKKHAPPSGPAMPNAAALMAALPPSHHKPPSATMPTVPPVPTAGAPATPAQPVPRKSRSGKEEKPRRKKTKTKSHPPPPGAVAPAAPAIPVAPPAPPVPAAPPAPAPTAQEFDVELVPLPNQPEPEAPTDFLSSVTRRELIAFFIGVGGASLAALAGWGLSRLLQRPRPSEQPGEEE